MNTIKHFKNGSQCEEAEEITQDAQLLHKRTTHHVEIYQNTIERIAQNRKGAQQFISRRDVGSTAVHIIFKLTFWLQGFLKRIALEVPYVISATSFF